jgi:hypothetical protein
MVYAVIFEVQDGGTFTMQFESAEEAEFYRAKVYDKEMQIIKSRYIGDDRSKDIVLAINSSRKPVIPFSHANNISLDWASPMGLYPPLTRVAIMYAEGFGTWHSWYYETKEWAESESPYESYKDFDVLIDNTLQEIEQRKRNRGCIVNLLVTIKDTIIDEVAKKTASYMKSEKY